MSIDLSYEQECMRAELLGLDKPDFEEFRKANEEILAQAKQQVEEEEVETETLADAEIKNEALKHMSGGLEELNSILKSTQKKISNFRPKLQQSCSSITSLLKFRSNSMSSSIDSQEQTGDGLDQSGVGGGETDSDPPNLPADDEEEDAASKARKSDLSKALDKHVDALDSLIDKAENAQFSMQHQNKQMKKFLK